MLTGGGDAPGLNAAISFVVKTAVIRYGWEVLGVKDGLHGLLTPTSTRSLTVDDVRGIEASGGTMLGGASKGVFTPMLYDPDYDPAECRRHYEDAVRNVRELGIDALIVIGGDGTQRIANGLAGYGVRVIGVPKTIDNDLYGTDRPIGFDSAVSKAVKSLSELRNTAASHDRVGVLEVMGRDAGWIALNVGVTGNADAILIPEIPFSMDVVADEVVSRSSWSARGCLVVVAEGATEVGSHRIFDQDTGSLGGIGRRVATDLAKRTGKEARDQVLGPLQRGAWPTTCDQTLAARLGARAVRAIAEGRFDQVVVLRGETPELVPMSECVSRVRRVPPDHDLIMTARDLGITFGDGAQTGCALEGTPRCHLATF